MPDTELEDLTQVLVLAFQALQKANELPPYLSAKAREINASNIHKLMEEKSKDGIALMQLMHANSRSKVCLEADLKTKESFLAFIEENKALMDRVKDTNFKLTLERFLAAHKLAVSLSEIVDEIKENEKLKDKTCISPRL